MFSLLATTHEPEKNIPEVEWDTQEETQPLELPHKLTFDFHNIFVGATKSTFRTTPKNSWSVLLKLRCVICTKAARQLNGLARISRFLSTAPRMVIYKSFIYSNFNHCPPMWHFCGKKNGNKMEKNQERTLGIIYRNHDSLYPELTRETGTYTMIGNRLRSM